jgi:malonate transporter MadL subunit
MIIYGVAILAFCFVIGQLIGEFLGKAIKVDANVGGVGFAMLLLIILSDWFNKKGFLDRNTENGLMFWNQMYIPIVVAMSATQNVRVAFSSGFIAVLAGLVPIVICAITIPFLANLSKNTQLD